MRLILACAMLSTMIACGGSAPTAPTPPPTIPQVTGQFAGTYRIDSCTESGAAGSSGFCAALANGGGHVFTPQQSGANLTGTLGFGGFSIPVTGSVGADSVIVLSGNGQIVPGAILTLQTWRGTLTGNTIAGTLQYVIATTDPFGSATVRATFSISK